MLKISGVDPRIDLTDYMGLIKPQGVVTVEQRPIFDYLVAQHVLRVESRMITMSAVDEIKSMGKKILFFRLRDGIHIYMHSDTMKTFTGRCVRMRLNRFNVNAPGLSTVFFDPSITNRPVE